MPIISMPGVMLVVAQDNDTVNVQPLLYSWLKPVLLMPYQPQPVIIVKAQGIYFLCVSLVNLLMNLIQWYQKSDGNNANHDN